MYTKEVMEHFTHPRNMGEIENPGGIGKVGNIICGDIMWIYIKVGKDENGTEIIEDIRFKTLGCAAAIATSSMITELAKKKTFEEAIMITRKDVANSLGGLPKAKIHCSVLATDALAEAIYDYLSKNNLPISEELRRKHERIEKELDSIKEKYKDFVEAQEKF